MESTIQTIAVNGNDLAVREIEGQRVVNYKQVAELHNCKVVNLRQNFKRNKKHFIEKTDYFQIREKNSESNNLSHTVNYFTESGYLMLAKSLTDDLSWTVQRELVNNYFKVRSFDSARNETPLQDDKQEEETQKIDYTGQYGIFEFDGCEFNAYNNGDGWWMKLKDISLYLWNDPQKLLKRHHNRRYNHRGNILEKGMDYIQVGSTGAFYVSKLGLEKILFYDSEYATMNRFINECKLKQSDTNMKHRLPHTLKQEASLEYVGQANDVSEFISIAMGKQSEKGSKYAKRESVNGTSEYFLDKLIENLMRNGIDLANKIDSKAEAWRIRQLCYRMREMLYEIENKAG